MTRPHEDLRHHAPTDHRPGGPAIDFPAGSWCAIDVVHVRADRTDAGVSAYETLIEEARGSHAKARSGVVLRSHDDRRVVAIVQLGGHDGFAHLKSAWDDHHLRAEHRTVAESSALALYQVASRSGAPEIDAASKDAYAFERITLSPEQWQIASGAIASAQGFRGALLFTSDDGSHSIAIYRFEKFANLAALRPNAEYVFPVKTFALTG
jgi:hypothetical protein